MNASGLHKLFPLGAADTPYRKLTADYVATASFEGERIVKVAPEALSLLAREAMVDCQHLLRPGHLAQLRAILEDPEASANDKFVAFDLLKNARSEEHTSELQSHSDLVCRLLLEKKKK